MANDSNYARKDFIILALLVFLIVYLVQLFLLQILGEYGEKADGNAFFRKPQYADRGSIYDRHGELLVFNQPSYDIMITMRELRMAERNGSPFDTIAFCNDIGITKDNFNSISANIKNRSKNPGYSEVIPQRFITQFSDSEYAVLQEKLNQYSGIYIQSRPLRKYTYKCAAHALGSVGEVSKKDIEADPYYRMGDYSGRNGVEKQYERELRGENGFEVLLRDNRGIIQGKYNDGELDKEAVAGKQLKLSIDIQLQKFGEELMANKIGSVVAIEPSTGEILALISSPNYDPAELVGRQRTANYSRLLKDPTRPLLDRPLMARYPPGSTFKMVNGLIALQENIITPESRTSCQNGYIVGKFRLGCHSHASPVNLRQASATSCNAFFCDKFREMLDHKKYGSVTEAFEVWRNDVLSFGFGRKLGVDFPNENRGSVPKTEVYDMIHGKNKWKSLNIVSLAIGQGEMITTPIQLANLAAIIGNRGYWYRPHIIKEIEGQPIDTAYTNKQQTRIDSKHFTPIIDGMEWALTGEGGVGGTARIAKIDSIVVCGKTGTAENPHGKDHSIFMAFAPRDNPQIAIGIVVENAGFGSAFAAPIASLMMEFYLKRSISPKRTYLVEHMSNINLIGNRNAKKQ